MKTSIQIYVSHRIDLHSYLPRNDFYIPMRCGAVFDTNPEPQITGDNTGDNISDRRETFCELTVQYWAWKHAKADYIGLCHYRRFLSITDRRFSGDPYGHVREPLLNSRSARKYGLNNQEAMERLIQGNDVVTVEYHNVCDVVTPKGRKNTVYDHWAAFDQVYIEKETLDLLEDIVQERHPQYLAAMQKFMNGSLLRGFNCFVMRRELFDEMCNFEFDVLFELEKRLDMTGYSQTMCRSPGFMGEILFCTYIVYLEIEGHKIATTQLIRFAETRRARNVFEGVLLWGKGYINSIKDTLFPPGTLIRKVLIRIKKEMIKHEGR